MYDPLRFAAPFLLTRRQISFKTYAETFRSDLLTLDKMKITRCLTLVGFEDAATVEIHNFSDASTTGYGQCSHIRLMNTDQKVHCAFIMGKSRVAQLKHITILRLELSAALVAVKVGTMLNIELSYENIVHIFWTDSTVVLE